MFPCPSRAVRLVRPLAPSRRPLPFGQSPWRNAKRNGERQLTGRAVYFVSRLCFFPDAAITPGGWHCRSAALPHCGRRGPVRCLEATDLPLRPCLSIGLHHYCRRFCANTASMKLWARVRTATLSNPRLDQKNVFTAKNGYFENKSGALLIISSLRLLLFFTGQLSQPRSSFRTALDAACARRHRTDWRANEKAHEGRCFRRALSGPRAASG